MADSEKIKTILLVEDEVIIAMMEQMTLEKFGYRVLTSLTGEEAVETAEAEPGIDLILMDIDLGKGIDGPEAATRILRKKILPIVFLTSHSEQEIVDMVRGITRYGYIIKNSGDFVLHSSVEMAFELFDANMKLQCELTMQKAAENELRFRNLVLSTVQESSMDGIFVVDGNERIVSSNRRFAEMWGIPAEVIDSGSAERALQTVMKSLKNGEDFLRNVRELFASKRKCSRDVIKLKDGRTFDCHSTPMLGLRLESFGRVWYFSDITEHKRIEEDLRTHHLELTMQNDELCRNQRTLEALHAKYFNLYDLAPVVYITLNEQGLVQEANLAAATLLGVKRGALIRQPFTRFIEREDQDVFYMFLKRLTRDGAAFRSGSAPEGRDGESQKCELHLLHSDETRFPAHIDATVIRTADGAHISLVVTPNPKNNPLGENISQDAV
jgi:PAS domain S-box-containing protein